MILRVVARLLALTFAISANAQRRPATTPPPPPVTPGPNIVVLMVDDLGWQDLSVPLYRDTTAANRRYATPAIAQLASTGVAFTDAYAVSTNGAVTRAALLTGQAQALPERVGNATLPRLLHAAGYQAIHVGETGWGGVGANTSDARAVGFDESVPGARRADLLTIDALKAMENARAAKKSFFVYIAYQAVRLPSAGDSRFLEAARARGLDEADAVYASLIAGVDQSVADIMTYLEQHQLVDKTIVVLLSDNGGLTVPPRSGLQQLQNAPLRGGMGSAYEGGLRIPMIVRWPGVARPGLRSGTPVTAGDLFPTLLRAARVATVAQVTRDLTGRDLASTLDNTKPVSFDRPLLWHTADYVPTARPAIEPFTALRAGSWKLIYFYRGSRYELYDLSNDIGESRERSLRQPEVASKLSELLRRALTDARVPMPIDSVYGRPYGLPGRLIVPGPPPGPSSPTPSQ